MYFGLQIMKMIFFLDHFEDNSKLNNIRIPINPDLYLYYNNRQSIDYIKLINLNGLLQFK